MRGTKDRNAVLHGVIYLRIKARFFVNSAVSALLGYFSLSLVATVKKQTMQQFIFHFVLQGCDWFQWKLSL